MAEESSGSSQQTWTAGTLRYTSTGLLVLFLWLLWGDFAWSMRDRSVGPVVQLLLKKSGASDTLMALFLTSLPALIGVILGPVISYNSDRHRGRRGRRIPFIMATTPVAALAMVGLGFSGPLGTGLVRLLHLTGAPEATAKLAVFGLLWTVFEIAAIASGAVFGGLINDVVPQPLLGRFYGLFRILSLLAGIIFNSWLIGSAEKHPQWLFFGIAALYGVGVMLMCFMVREGEYPPPPDVVPGERQGFVAALRVYFRECFSKPYYLSVYLAMTAGALFAMPVNTYSVPFAKSLGLDMKQYGHYLAITYSISLAVAYLLGWLVDRFHPLRVTILAVLCYGVVLLWGGLVPVTVGSFAVVLVAHGVLSGTYFTVSASLGQRLFPKSTFAQFASAQGLMGAAATAGASPIVGAILDHTHHQYRYTFLMSGALAVVATGLMVLVYRQFTALGGPEGYVAPE